jgi:hypothetical protein
VPCIEPQNVNVLVLKAQTQYYNKIDMVGDVQIPVYDLRTKGSLCVIHFHVIETKQGEIARFLPKESVI